jgi:hypothetical protein
METPDELRRIDGFDEEICVACQGLIAGKPAPTVMGYTDKPVGAGLPAMGPFQALHDQETAG